MKNTIKQSRGKIAQAGFTAIELLVVLIVGVTIYALSTGKIDMLFSGSEMVEESGNIGAISGNIRALKTNSGYGANGTNLTASLVAIKGTPKNVSVVSGVMYNLWGGTIVPTSTGAGFAIAYSQVPQDACVKLATKIAAGGTFASTAINGGSAIVGEVTAAQATTQCNTNSNSMVFTATS